MVLTPLRAATPTIAEQIVQLPAGCLVELRTKTNEKLRGRLGALSTDSFELQVAQSGQLQAQPLRYDQVKSIKLVDRDRGMGTAGKVGIGALIVIGTLALVAGILAAIANR
ncbi:MAG TPA: hypothetical protein VGF49_19150 [Candidatus Solibacter sp.]